VDHDALVVGGGHNGLVAACYLARSGMNVAVLERRGFVGGAAVTEELIPGFRVSSGAYSLSLLRPDVYHDLELARHGLEFFPKDPQMFVPQRDGRSFFIWRDEAATLAEIARVNRRDAEGYKDFNAFWEEAVSLLRPAVESFEPPKLSELRDSFVRRGKQELWHYAVEGSAAEVVSRFFESDELRGAFASQGIIGAAQSVYEPGTAWVMAYHFMGGELNGATGTWAYAKGGMGGVTAALRGSAEEMGVEIVADAEVRSVVVDGGRARGVLLTDGRQMSADTVVSNADPKRTFLELVPSGELTEEFLDRVKSFETRGCVLKVNMALAELPDFAARPGVGPQHRGTIEVSFSLDHLSDAFAEARLTGFASLPFMEVFIQSTIDPSLAPEGQHVLSAFSQYVFPEVKADWNLTREAATNAVLDLLEELAPGTRSKVLAVEALGPPELEQRFGLTDGDIFHGQISPEQSFGERFGYKTPIDGLYLCGSGASPGGGVMGAAGRNAAKVILATPHDM
jgi:phytoene dehydrogenase-like protein